MYDTLRQRLEAAARDAEDSLDARRLPGDASSAAARRRGHKRAAAGPGPGTAHTGAWARRAMASLVEGADGLRLQTVRAADLAIGHVREEPIRSVVWAFLAGVLLQAVVARTRSLAR